MVGVCLSVVCVCGGGVFVVSWLVVGIVMGGV